MSRTKTRGDPSHAEGIHLAATTSPKKFWLHDRFLLDGGPLTAFPPELESDINEHYAAGGIDDFTSPKWADFHISLSMNLYSGRPTHFCVNSSPYTELQVTRFRVSGNRQVVVAYLPPDILTHPSRCYVIIKARHPSAKIHNYNGEAGAVASSWTIWQPTTRRTLVAASQIPDVMRVSRPPTAPVYPASRATTEVEETQEPESNDEKDRKCATLPKKIVTLRISRNSLHAITAAQQKENAVPNQDLAVSSGSASELKFRSSTPLATRESPILIDISPPRKRRRTSSIHLDHPIQADSHQNPAGRHDTHINCSSILEDGDPSIEAVDQQNTSLQEPKYEFDQPTSQKGSQSLQSQVFKSHPQLHQSTITTRDTLHMSSTPTIIDPAVSDTERLQVDYSRVRLDFIEDDKLKQSCLLTDCNSATALFEEACFARIADPKTRMLGVMVNDSEVDSLSRDNERHFRERLLEPLKRVLRSSSGLVTVKVQKFL